MVANDETINLTGAWRGPKDLMVNICEDNNHQPYVGFCGIFRTYGWSDFSTTVAGDSIIMVSKEVYSPFVGHFKIDSADRLVGKLTMGNPDDAWYFNGETELLREKPVMPANLNADLEGIILEDDYGILSHDRQLAREILSNITPASEGYTHKKLVEELLDAKPLPVTPADMVGFTRVRSIQVAPSLGIFTYPYFKCRFRERDGKIFFEKTTGSQRKSGYVYQNGPDSLIFLGGWSVNNDPQTTYGSPNSTAGTLYKIAPRRALLIFPSADRLELYELTR